MADDAAEVEDDHLAVCRAEPQHRHVEQPHHPLHAAGGTHRQPLGRPVVLDPVGAGASHLRTETALRLLREVKFTVIRGNISEIRTLAAGSGTTKAWTPTPPTR